MKLNSKKVFSFYSNKTVLITGESGFKGSWLASWLNSLGAKVVGFSDKVPTNPSLYEDLELNEVINSARGDIRDSDALNELVFDTKPDLIFHLAAQPLVHYSYKEPIETFSTNIIGTANLINAVRLLDEINHKCSVVLITSDKVYKNNEWIWGYRETDELWGKDPYSASKSSTEQIIYSMIYSYFSKTKSSVNFSTARAGNVIGGGDWSENRIVPDLMRAVSTDSTAIVRNPNSVRPWQHVLEPLRGYLYLGYYLYEKNINHEAFNFGPNIADNFTVSDIINKFSTWDKIKVQIDTEQAKKFKSEAGLLRLSCEKATNLLNWKPLLSFHETCTFTLDWYRSYFENKADISKFTREQIDLYMSLLDERK